MLKAAVRIACCCGLTLVAVLGLSMNKAAADRPQCDVRKLICEEGEGTPPKPGGADTPATGGTVAACSLRPSGKAVPCSGPHGTWSDEYQCYLRLDPNQPPPPQPGRKGQYYFCYTPIAGTAEFDLWIDGGAPVDPGQVAREILARIQLKRVGIGITPEPGRTGVLGLPTYLWVNNAGAHTLGPISDSATEGGVTVTLTARVSKVVWNLGDGTTITCAGPGTPYRDEFGARPSPTCGHTYQHPSTDLPGGVYRVSATALWDVAWTGGGQSGQIPFEVGSNTTISIGEVQALT